MKQTKNKKLKKVKESKIFYIAYYSDGTGIEGTYVSEDEVKENCSDGEIVYKVKATKKYKVVDESVKLVEIK